MKKEDIIKAYCWIRENNQSISDDVLDLMKDSAIENLNDNWIKIESESDLPKDKPIDIIVNNYPYQGYVYQGRKDWFCLIENRYGSKPIEDDCIEARRITHYKEIIMPNIPIV